MTLKRYGVYDVTGESMDYVGTVRATSSNEAEYKARKEFSGVLRIAVDAEGEAVDDPIKDHAWLSRFRQADYQNKYHELSPWAAHDIASIVDKLIDEHARLREAVRQLAKDHPDTAVTWPHKGRTIYRELRDWANYVLESVA